MEQVLRASGVGELYPVPFPSGPPSIVTFLHCGPFARIRLSDRLSLPSRPDVEKSFILPVVSQDSPGTERLSCSWHGSGEQPSLSK